MDAPKWALEEYPGAEKDFSDWLERMYLENYYGDQLGEAIDMQTGEVIDNNILMRIRSMAKFQTLQRTLQLRGTIERAQVWQLYNANQMGWFRLLPPEFDTVEELVASMVDDTEEGTSEYSDLIFLAKQILPLLKKAGATPEQLAGLTVNMSKARAAVPFLRQIIRDNSEKNDGILPEKEEVVKKTMLQVAEEIISPDISVREFRRSVQEQRGRVFDAVPNAKGRQYILNGQEVFLIQCESRDQARMIEIAIRKIVDLQISDVATLLKDTTMIVKGESL